MSRLHFLSLTTIPVKILSAQRRILSNATAFFFQSSDSRIFLITNWHVVTGRDPANPRNSPTGAVPCLLQTRIHRRLVPTGRPDTIRLTEFGDMEFELNCENGDNPTWLEHPQFRRQVDVVAIDVPNCDELKEQYTFNTLNTWNAFRNDYVPEAMDDVFVIGYPWGISQNQGILPIYKRGCIASDPVVPIDGLPKLLIDCRTASGMSGGPVIVSHSGVWSPGGTFSDDSVIGTVNRFLGIYAGRLYERSQETGPNRDISEIGIVWKQELLESLTNTGIPGTTLREMLTEPIVV